MVSILKRFVIASCLLLVSARTYADALIFNMTPGVTPVSKAEHSLHMVGFIVVCVIGFLVFSVLIYSLIRHRKSLGVKPAVFHENIQIEIIWTIIPFIILIALAVPASNVLIFSQDTSKSEMTVTIRGHQWYWHYDYLNEGVSFFSNLISTKEQIDGLLEKK